MAGNTKPRVAYIESWRDIPAHMNVDASTEAASYPPGNVLYIKRGAPEWLKEHELYHLRKRHSVNPRAPKKFVEQERDAYLHAYRKTKRPKVLRRRIRSVAADLHRKYDLPYTAGAGLIRKEFKAAEGVPQQWLEDTKFIKREAAGLYKELRKGRPYFCLTCNEWHVKSEKKHRLHVRSAEIWR